MRQIPICREEAMQNRIFHEEVLDGKGFISVVGNLGDDLTVVNSARVSFGKQKSELDDSDIKLIKYLKEHKHYSPFRHVVVQFHIKMPEFVMRQWYKHVVGIETTSSYPTKDHAWNEISGRYIPITDYYRPTEWRAQHENNKQASAGALDQKKQQEVQFIFDTAMHDLFRAYETLLDLGVAKEQARILLPLNMYTEIYWTASLQAIMHFIELRDHAGAQGEIQECARVMENAMRQILPTVTNIWLGDKSE